VSKIRIDENFPAMGRGKLDHIPFKNGWSKRKGTVAVKINTKIRVPRI